MRQLWVQLSLAFTVLVIIGSILLSIVGDLGARAETERFGNELIFAENGVVAQLTTHFANNGTIEDARQIVRDEENDLRELPIRIDFQLRNNNNRIIIGNIPPQANFQEIPFQQDGQTIATLRYAINNDSPPPRRGNNSNDGNNSNSGNNSNDSNNSNSGNSSNNGNSGNDGNNSNDNNNPQVNLQPSQPVAESPIGTIVIVGAILGITGGIFMSRQLTKPLAQLAQTAQQFGNRDFSSRSKITGTQEVRDVAQAFNNMADAIQESETLRNNLIADTAHELRTPLSVMKGNLRAIIDDVYPLSKTEIMHLYEQTRHLSRLVNDLHELALADARELPLHPTKTDIATLITEVADIFSPVAEADNIKLETDIRLPLPALMLDAGRIRQVIHNLLVNALRYTPENGEVTLRAFQENNAVIIEIEDSGIGISEEHLKHIFERLYRVNSSRGRDSGGTGLGLAIGKAIIESHGGKITVRSKTSIPSGTCFKIALPIQA